MVRALGVFGSACKATGNILGAARAFEEANAIAASSESTRQMAVELWVIQCRKADWLMAIRQWTKALDLADEAVLFFSENRIRDRDDCSIDMALLLRGRIILEAYRAGEDCNLGRAAEDFKAVLAEPSWEGIHLAAIHNLSLVATSRWFQDGPVHRGEADKILASARMFRMAARRLGYRRQSNIHAKSRWLEGLARVQLAGMLTPDSELWLRGARSDLERNGATLDFLMLTLDIQWWLFKSGEWGRAVQEVRALNRIVDCVPDNMKPALEVWIEAVQQQRFSGDVAEAFALLRGIRSAALPWTIGPRRIKKPEAAEQKPPDADIGW